MAIPTIIPNDAKVPVLLSDDEVLLIRDETHLEPEMLACSLIEQGKCRFNWTLGDIDYVGGFVAATANHTDDKKLKKRLDALFFKLQSILDAHIEESSVKD